MIKSAATKALISTVGAAGLFVAGTQVANADTINVASGDTVSAYAAKYNVSIDDIVKANKLADANLIIAGESIEIPDSSASAEDTAATTGSTHVSADSAGNAYAWGQCTWYVKTVASWAGNHWGNGNQWGASAAAEGFTVNSTPAAGTIVSFAGGQSVGGWTADASYGHVAYVQSYNAANNTITISQGGLGFGSPAGPNYQTISAAGLTYIHQ